MAIGLLDKLDLKRQFDLKPMEIVFLAAWIQSGDLYTAYVSSHPRSLAARNPNDAQIKLNAQKQGSRIFQRIKRRIDWPGFLELVGLGLDRVALEIQRGLEANSAVFYKGKEVAVVTDNMVRARTRELLADLHGLRKREVTLNAKIQHRTDPDLSVIPDDDLDELERITGNAVFSQN